MLQHRVINEYSDDVHFKVEKVKKPIFKPFTLTRYPNRKKVLELDSTSTKRSSRESSKHKTSPQNVGETNSNLNLVKVENFEKPENQFWAPTNVEASLLELTKAQNDELKAEIHSLMLHDNLDMHLEVPALTQKHVSNFHVDYESLPSYHDEEEFDKAYEEYDNKKFRSRGISGWNNDLEVINLDPSNSFLLGNERETHYFEPFVTEKLFNKGFVSDLKNHFKQQ